MTRETKVGLLVGMGVILLIGIIVSDHLSQVQPPAVFTDYVLEAQQSIGPQKPPSRDPAPVEPQPMAEAEIPLRVAPPPALPQEPDPVPPLVPASRTESDFTTTSTSIAPDSAASEPAPGLSTPPRAPAPEPLTRPLPQDRLAVNSGTDQVAAPTTTRSGRPQPHAGTSSQPMVHYVKEDETLWGLAERYYGSGGEWRTIVEANPGRIPENHRVRAGVRLVIPNKASVMQHQRLTDAVDIGEPTRDTSATTRITRTPRRSAPSTDRQALASSDVRSIVVKPHDTLSSLAGRYLGDEKRWRELYEFNKRTIDDPDVLPAGVKLVLPPEARPDDDDSRSSRATRPASAVRRATSPSARPDTKPRTYTVRKHDTLIRIAERELGDAHRWREIYDANRKVLKSPDRIPLGQKLTIPRGDQS